VHLGAIVTVDQADRHPPKGVRFVALVHRARVSMTVDQTFDSAITLGIIVLVRTFLSFSLEIELEGTLPWRHGSTEKRPDPAVSVGDGPG
jgi:hypothetical protein